MLDYLKVSDLLTPDERLMRESVRSFIDAELMPHIEEWFDSGDVPTRDIMLV